MEKREKLLTIKEESALIDGLTEYRIRQLCITGELKCFKAGKKYLFTERALYNAVLGGRHGGIKPPKRSLKIEYAAGRNIYAPNVEQDAGQENVRTNCELITNYERNPNVKLKNYNNARRCNRASFMALETIYPIRENHNCAGRPRRRKNHHDVGNRRRFDNKESSTERKSHRACQCAFSNSGGRISRHN